MSTDVALATGSTAAPARRADFPAARRAVHDDLPLEQLLRSAREFAADAVLTPAGLVRRSTRTARIWSRVEMARAVDDTRTIYASALTDGRYLALLHTEAVVLGASQQTEAAALAAASEYLQTYWQKHMLLSDVEGPELAMSVLRGWLSAGGAP